MTLRREDWPGIACVAAHLALGVLLFQPALFPGSDTGQYLVLGESLRTGHGLRDLYIPGAPLHAKFPPGYPALLAALGLLGGFQLMKWASLALTAAATWGLWRLARRRLDRPAAALATIPLAVSPVLLDYSHFILSEALFTALVVASLVMAERSLASASDGSSTAGGDGQGGTGAPGAPGGIANGAWTAAVLLAGAAFLTRTAGLPLLVTLVVVAAVRPGRRVGRVAITLSVALLVVAGWAVYQRLADPAQPGYLQQLFMANPYDPAAGSVGAAGLARRVATNVWLYLSSELPASFGVGPGRRGDPGVTALVVGVLVAGAAFAGWVRGIARGARPLEVFVLLYAGLLALWPEVWTDRRFLLPALPALLPLAVSGAEMLARRVRRLEPSVAAGGLALLLAVPSAGSALRLLPERAACRASYREGRPCDPPANAAFYAAARWTRGNTPADAIVANRSPAIFYVLSRRQGGLYPFSRDPDVVLRGLERLGADFVVVDQLSGTTWLYLVPAIQAHADRFRALWSTGDPPTAVLRFERSERTAEARP